MATKEKTKKESGLSIAETIKSIKRQFGNDAVMTLNQKPLVGLEAVSTGSFGLDVALGIGGLPRGRIVEIYGPESSGKTTLALHVIAEAQKMGGVCAYIDTENAMDPEYAKKLGVKTDELFISQPSSGEEALSIVESYVASGQLSVVVVDSVPALTPKAILEGELEQAHIALLARMMSKCLGKLTSMSNKSKTIVIFINQIRINPAQGGYGSPEYTPGGKALKFYTSVRLDIRRIAQIKKGEEVMGGRVRVKVIKNKVAPPFKHTEFDLMYGEGISREGEILALGQLHGIIQKEGQSYIYREIKLGRGYDNSREFLKGNKETAEKIINEIKDKLLIKVAPENELETNVSEE